LPYFVEKPACLNVDDISKLLKLPNFEETRGMVGFMMRFVPTFKLLKEFIDMKLLGDINIIQCSMNVSQVFSKGSGWRFKKETSGGGVVATQGIHLIDLLYWYFGMPTTVHSFLASPYSCTVEDTASLLFDYGKFGITANISWSSHEKRLLETIINIEGDKGSITVDDDNIELYLTSDINKFKKGWTIINKNEISELCHFDIGAPAYSLQDKFFIDSLINLNAIESDLTSSFHVQTILEDIYK
jgi:predicted dehydrogenase